MGRSSKRRHRRARSLPDKEIRTVDVPLDVCTDVVRRVLAAEVGAVDEPATGFFQWTEGSRWNRVRYTLRTYAAVPGTRITLEARSDLASSPYLLALFTLVLVATAGVGIVFLMPFLATVRSERRREVAMFKWLRAIELALTPTQGSYRIASGALVSAPPARGRAAPTALAMGGFRQHDEGAPSSQRSRARVRLVKPYEADASPEWEGVGPSMFSPDELDDPFAIEAPRKARRMK